MAQNCYLEKGINEKKSERRLGERERKGPNSYGNCQKQLSQARNCSVMLLTAPCCLLRTLFLLLFVALFVFVKIRRTFRLTFNSFLTDIYSSVCCAGVGLKKKYLQVFDYNPFIYLLLLMQRETSLAVFRFQFI